MLTVLLFFIFEEALTRCRLSILLGET